MTSGSGIRSVTQQYNGIYICVCVCVLCDWPLNQTVLNVVLAIGKE